MPHSPRPVVVGALVGAGVLLVAAPGPTASWQALSSPGSATDVTAPLVALVTLLAWGCALWLLLSAALVAGGRLPGLLGAVLRRAAGVVVPRTLRRTLEVALGVALVAGGPGTAWAAGPDAPGGPTLVAGPAATRQTVPAPEVAPPAPPGPSTAALDHPTGSALDRLTAGPAAPTAAALDHPTAGPARPAHDGPAAAPAGPPSRRAALPASAPDVVVRPGDTLWSLAAERLGTEATPARTAQAWPAWWQANRTAVGDDPDLLRPGTALTPPEDV